MGCRSLIPRTGPESCPPLRLVSACARRDSSLLLTASTSNCAGRLAGDAFGEGAALSVKLMVGRARGGGPAGGRGSSEASGPPSEVAAAPTGGSAGGGAAAPPSSKPCWLWLSRTMRLRRKGSRAAPAGGGGAPGGLGPTCRCLWRTGPAEGDRAGFGGGTGVGPASPAGALGLIGAEVVLRGCSASAPPPLSGCGACGWTRRRSRWTAGGGSARSPVGASPWEASRGGCCCDGGWRRGACGPSFAKERSGGAGSSAIPRRPPLGGLPRCCCWCAGSAAPALAWSTSPMIARRLASTRSWTAPS
mmetsp:Transcript_25484/g.60627  ORF Transcript_25484/g.60627 Transcript_25484/m.60627 type:complete len:304 (-) Transcript_25484:429-1340(-)